MRPGTGRDSPVLTALLVPFADLPPGVAVTEPGDRLRVDWGDTVDELGRREWRRTPPGAATPCRLRW